MSDKTQEKIEAADAKLQRAVERAAKAEEAAETLRRRASLNVERQAAKAAAQKAKELRRTVRNETKVANASKAALEAEIKNYETAMKGLSKAADALNAVNQKTGGAKTIYGPLAVGHQEDWDAIARKIGALYAATLSLRDLVSRGPRGDGAV